MKEQKTSRDGIECYLPCDTSSRKKTHFFLLLSKISVLENIIIILDQHVFLLMDVLKPFRFNN